MATRGPTCTLPGNKHIPAAMNVDCGVLGSCTPTRVNPRSSLLLEMKIHHGFNVPPPPRQSQTDTAGTSWTWGGVDEDDDEADEVVALLYYYENKQKA